MRSGTRLWRRPVSPRSPTPQLRRTRQPRWCGHSWPRPGSDLSDCGRDASSTGGIPPPSGQWVSSDPRRLERVDTSTGEKVLGRLWRRLEQLQGSDFDWEEQVVCSVATKED
jgi:hypothetical protein